MEERSAESIAPVIKALHVWAEGHPRAQRPFLVVLGHTFTPKSFVKEVEKQSEFARPFLDYLFETANRLKVTPEYLIYSSKR
jgi:hypothetical protein